MKILIFYRIRLGNAYSFIVGETIMSSELQPDIIYTIVDEAPELASASLLPVIKAFSKAAGVKLGSKDISLAGRILAEFPDFLDATQQRSNDLELLGKVVL